MISMVSILQEVMKERKKIFVSDQIGEVSSELIVPERARFLMVLAHGAGANMDHHFMIGLAETLASENIGSLRFNFPFMENGKGRPDLPRVAHSTIRAVVEYASVQLPSITIVGGGKSFGGRMTSQLMALEPGLPLKSLVFYGFPLHPAKKPGIERAQHLSDVKVPMLFLQGTKDDLANIGLMREICSSLNLATLHVIEGANHSMNIGKKEAIGDLAKKTKEYLNSLHIG